MKTQKNTHLFTVLICLIALMFSLSGCKKSSVQPVEPNKGETTTPKTPVITEPNVAATTEHPANTGLTTKAGRGEMEIVPLEGLGSITFGMSKDQIIEKWGQPTRAEGIALHYFAKGVSFLLDPTVGLRQVDCWSKDYPEPPTELLTFAGKTDKGIAMGADKQQIIAAYGEPTKTAQQQNFEIITYTDLKMDFFLLQNKLVQLRIIAPK